MAFFRSRAALQFEILALRHQLGVLQRSVKRPKLTAPDRLLWAWLSAVWRQWQSTLAIVKPATVIGWHHQGFRLFWHWKIRRGKPGRPGVPKEIRSLIRKMSRDNPLWGAPRIHGELLKLDIDVGETSVSKYMIRHRHPPSENGGGGSLTQGKDNVWLVCFLVFFGIEFEIRLKEVLLYYILLIERNIFL